ncbi:MFS transporter [Amycolatopsis suaedae]|uniref:MFS transporter n=1 Tax=Amycolatopsis suaedae TaxID=2510978 RepID=A0A4Q7IYI8_9PSEU|nr:MFS transporter [Amycolatopsis suaedae]RZQ60051.1 MFS transporter [Amycolatopsis suaedae]
MVQLTARAAGVREWLGLAVLALPTALLGLDLTVLYLVVPHLAEELRPSATEMLWIMDAYGFLVAGFLVTMGTLGDRIGRRRLLLIGAVAFGVVSVVAAYATSAEMLIAARAALGIAGATLMPSTLALISNMFPDARQRAVAIGVWATMFAGGMAAGPLVGGVLLEHFWWGSAFLVAVPVSVVLLVAGPVLLPEYRDPRGGRLDLPGVALSLATLLPAVYVVKHLAKDGFDATTVLALVAALVFGVLFVRRQRRVPDPLVDVRLFADRRFGFALGMLLLGLVGVGGTLMLVAQYLQSVEGLSPLAAGAWMGPPALMMLIAGVVAPRVARRVRPGYVVATTLALSTVGYLILATVDGPGETVPVVAGFALVYLGLGVLAALGTDLVVGAAPPERAGSASALSETVQELGLAFGVATLGSLATAVYRAEAGPPGGDSLPEAAAAALPAAKVAFAQGLSVSSLVAGAATLGLAVATAVALRRIGPLGSSGYGGESHRE